MPAASESWVVVADGSQARIYDERRRDGKLHEAPAWNAKRETEDRPGVHAWLDRVVAEDRFLKHFGGKLGRAARRGQFKSLVLIAPPHALGALREGLADASSLIEVSDPHERTHESRAEIEARVRSLRQPL
jgi:protein required for attachment to host cells